ncbi:MAG: YraN family protein [Pirellulales bacterium]
MTPSRDELGRRGEDEAAAYLRRLGYRIVGRRERILRGDIDIVALDDRTVVFVEVRTRSATTHGHPAETVGRAKQLRIATLANAYIRRHRLQDTSVRIDVVAVTFDAEGRAVVEHYQNAFDDPG